MTRLDKKCGEKLHREYTWKVHGKEIINGWSPSRVTLVLDLNVLFFLSILIILTSGLETSLHFYVRADRLLLGHGGEPELSWAFESCGSRVYGAAWGRWLGREREWRVYEACR